MIRERERRCDEMKKNMIVLDYIKICNTLE